MNTILKATEHEILIKTLSCIGDGVIVTNVEGNIIFMNKIAGEITGWKIDAALGEKFEGVLTLVNGNTFEDLGNLIKQVIQSKKVVGLKKNSKLALRDGSSRFISASCSPITNADEAIIGVVVVFRDISRLRRAEQELEEERSNLKSAFEAAPVSMIIADKNGGIRLANKPFLEMIDGDVMKIVGKGLGDGISCINSFKKGCGKGEKCVFCKFKIIINSVIKEGITHRDVMVQHTTVINNQEVDLWFKLSLTPIMMSGEMQVMIAIEDVTKQKENEAKIVEAKDYSLKMLEDFPTPIWRLDKDNQLSYYNNGLLDFSGMKLKETNEKGWALFIHPDDYEMFFNTCSLSLSIRESFETEVRLRRKDGEYRWMLIVARPLYDLKNQFDGYIGMILDIHERKINEEVLKKYQILSEKARDIILFVDLDGKIIEANEAAIKAYGYTSDEMKSLTLYDLRKKREPVVSQLKKAEDEGIYFHSIHYRKDGTSFPVAVNAQSANIGDKRVVVSIIRDITERKRVEKELQKAKEEAEKGNKSKSEFLANMSHEIRTPLNGMLGMIDLTLLTELDKEQKENLTTAKSCARSLLKIINDVLDFSKMEVGKLDIDNMNFNIKELIEDTVKIHSNHANEKGLDLNYSLSTSIPQYLKGDPNRLRQILNNLINNAIKFTDYGEVSVSVKKHVRSDDKIELKFAVSDDGIGIASEDKDKLFKSFSQLDGSYTKKYKGTGLGLVISKELAEMMGGGMWVESEKGKGSTFYFTVKFEAGIKNIEKATYVPTISKSANPQSVLLVEDDQVNQVVLARILREKGHAVDIANDGMEALSMFEEGRYDVILMDIQMPVMDGIETTKRIREIENLEKHTPIIAITAFALHGDREKFLSMGIDRYIAKPVQIDELLYTIEMVSRTKKVTQSKLHSEFSHKGSARIDENGDVTFTNEIKRKPKEELLATINVIESNIKLLNRAINDNEYYEIEGIASQIKGLSNEIDAEALKTLAFKIQLATRQGSVGNIMKYVIDMHHEFNTYKKSVL